MTEKYVALLIIAAVFSFVLPYIIKKKQLKDDIKFKNTLPIGTAKFRAFLKFIGWTVLIVLVISLVLNLLD
jgi:hypothetical protein